MIPATPLIVALVLLGLAPAAKASQLKGDINADGRVNAADALLLQRHLTEGYVLTTAEQDAADVAPLIGGVPQPDTLLTLGDLTVLLRAVQGEIDLPRSLGNPAVIDTVQVWEAGLPYTIPQDLEITDTGKLTLRPGVEIRFGTGGTFTVQPGGELDVQGEATNRVVLTADGSTTPGDWEGLAFSAGALPITVTLTNAEIRYANRAVDVSGANLTLVVTGGLISDFASRGIELSGSANATINGVTIDNGTSRTGRGIDIDGPDPGTTTITGCTIQGAGRGISLSNTSPGISQNTLQDNNRGIHIGQRSDPVINGQNVFTLNDYGIYIEGNNSFENQDPKPVIEDNQIFDNAIQDLWAWRFGEPDVAIEATGNYWGEIDPIQVANNISDLSDESDTNQNGRPWVEFIPYDETPGVEYLHPGTFLWRKVAANTTLLGAGPHAIVGRVTVDPLVTLRIDSLKEVVVPPALPEYVPVAVNVGNTSRLIVDGTLEIVGRKDTMAMIDAEVTIESTESSPAIGDWDGIEFRDASMLSTIDHAIIRHARIPIDVDQSDLVIANSQISLFGVGTSIGDPAAIRYTNSTGSIVGNSINGEVPGTPPTPNINNGITLIDSPVSIIDNAEITNVQLGILLIGEASLSGVGGPIAITGNSLFDNTQANLRLERMTNPEALLGLNATGNAWGADDAAGVVATIQNPKNSPPNGLDSVSIDFSNFIDTLGQTVTGSFFKFALRNVIRTKQIFNPSMSESVDIQFELAVASAASPATVTLNVCLETVSSCSPTVHQDSAVYTTSGSKAFTWDGTDDATGLPVASEGYSYELVVDDGVDDGVNQGVFDPAREFQVAAGLTTTFANPLDPGTGFALFNTHRTEPILIDITLAEPARLGLDVETVSVLPSRAFPSGSSQMKWEGFDAQGMALDGDLAVHVRDDGKMRPNTVVVESAPVVTASPPAIEIVSSPYLLYRSYGQPSADLVYRLDQTADVTITLLPPGVSDPSSGIEIFSQTGLAAGIDHTAVIDSAVTETGGEGTYAVHVAAANGSLVGTYVGAVQLRR